MDPKNDRPDLAGNDETAAAGAFGGGMAGEGAAAARAADAGAGTAGEDKAQEGLAPYAAAGRAFTIWFNRMLSVVPNSTLKLGTKTARVETLHDDGRLEVYVQGEGGRDEQQYVAFDASHLDMLLLKFAAAAR